jgi:arylsulfatase A-like enzyme
MAKRPNVLLILNDDMGYSDIGCYGGEVQTPSLDKLAEGGLRLTQFYNTARCCPSRASLLTGLHPHQADVGHMVGSDDIDGYIGDLAPDSVTIAEVLKASGYATFLSGKWHVTAHTGGDGPKHNWPLQRGFDDFYGIITGAGSFYDPPTLTRGNERISVPDDDKDYFVTDAISDQMVDYIEQHVADDDEKPFFGYLAYTAPHWPLHAHEEDIAKYDGRFDAGWDQLRQERLERMVELGLLDPQWALSPRDPSQPAWEDAPDKEWEARRMAVYAAQIDRMDQGIGRVIDTLERTGELENTLIIFLADNGGCAENFAPPVKYEDESWIWIPTKTRAGDPVYFGNGPSLIPGGPETYCSYGVAWANLSNTPFREYKHWIHEGGISTPLIVHYPAGLDATAAGELRTTPAQLPDIMATILDVTGAEYLSEREGVPVKPCEGFTMTPIFANDEGFERTYLYWEHEGNRAIRKDNWKLVRKWPGDWELYDMDTDRTELNDLLADRPAIRGELSAEYFRWAHRAQVMDWDELEAIRYEKFGKVLEDEGGKSFMEKA